MGHNLEIFLNSEAPAPRVAAPRSPRRIRDQVSQVSISSGLVENEIAKLVQRTFFCFGQPQQRSVVAFCGIDRGAGCSWVCGRAGEMLAGQVDSRVCVVDANLRLPSLHQYFLAGASPGLADAMNSSRPIGEYVQPTCNSRLWLLTAGSGGWEQNGAPNAVRLRARLSELRSEFDYILLDTPAFGSYADAILIGQLSDGIILVVDSQSTRREPARVAKDSLQRAGVQVLGAVLNRKTYPIPAALYQRL